jgi:deoxycytidylate deaminase
MGAIVQAGIKEVVYFNNPPPMDGETWRDTIGESADLARQVNILLRRGGDR